MSHNRDCPKWWRSNYNIREKMDFLRYRLASPKTKSDLCCDSMNNIDAGIIRFTDNISNYHLVIIGDFMPVDRFQIRLTDRLLDLVNSSNTLILNLEGVIVDKKRLFALSHHDTVLSQIKELFSIETAINVANNHAADFGKDLFSEQIEVIKQNGFQVFGYNNQNYSPISGINIYSASYWSNQPLNIINRFDYSDTLESSLETPHNSYNIFIPHWGYEMHLTPDLLQQRYAYKLLDSGWDAIIGSHSHSPQPIEIYNQKPIAYSLGNFCYDNINPNHSHGRIVKMGFSLSPNRPPLLDSVENYFTSQEYKDGIIEIDLCNRLVYSSKRRCIRYNYRYFQDLLK